MIGAKGLGGGLRVELLTDHPDRLAPGAEVWLDPDQEPRRIERIERGRTPVVYLSGVSTREAAEGVLHRYLETPRQPLPEGEFYWDELVGLRVEHPDGTPVGELVEIFRAGGNEVYRVVGADGERLVPALRRVVRSIDLERRVMVVDPDEAEEVR